MINKLKENLNYYIPNPKCELNYDKDYELLISVMLSAQCKDKRVNEVTKKLYKYKIINDNKKIIPIRKESNIMFFFFINPHFTT